jgi:hypothetical protein
VAVASRSLQEQINLRASRAAIEPSRRLLRHPREVRAELPHPALLDRRLSDFRAPAALRRLSGSIFSGAGRSREQAAPDPPGPQSGRGINAASALAQALCGLVFEKTIVVNSTQTAPLARAQGIRERDLWKYSFKAPLERCARREGYNCIPIRLTSEFFDTLDSLGRPGLAATTESEQLKS